MEVRIGQMQAKAKHTIHFLGQAMASKPFALCQGTATPTRAPSKTTYLMSRSAKDRGRVLRATATSTLALFHPAIATPALLRDSRRRPFHRH